MDTPAEAIPTLFDQSGVIIADTACRRCGYNLRGLHQDGRCPECGTPIGLSTHGDLLRFADPQWVDKLAVGMRYMVWGIVIAIAVGLIGGCLTTALRSGPAPMQAAVFLAGLIGLYGAWLATAPDPSGIGEDRYVTARKIVRMALLVGLLSSITQPVIQVMPALPKALFVLLLIGGVVSGLIGLVGEFAKFTYLGALADRVPDASLAGRARFLRWALTICLAALIVGGVALSALATRAGGGPGLAAFTTGAPAPASAPTPIPTSGPDGGPGPTTAATPAPLAPGPTPGAGGPFGAGPSMAAGCAFGVLGLAVLVFQVMAFILFIRLGRRFREQAGIARQTWAAVVGPASPVEPSPEPPASP